MRAGRERIEAESLLRRFGISVPAEIDVDALAHLCGAQVLYRQLDGCEARVVEFKGRSVIRVRHDVQRSRQRFSVAHELGHLLLDSRAVPYVCDVDDLRPGSEGRTTAVENRANRFAAELLMPFSMLTPRRKRELTVAGAQRVAKQFGVSLSAAAWRLVELDDQVGALLCYDEHGRWKWWVRGPSVARRFWPKSTRPEGTRSAFDRGSSARGRWADPGKWLDGTREGDDDVVESSHVSCTGHSLTILWWKEGADL